MANLFKPWLVRYIDTQGHRVKKGTRGAIRKKERSKKWYGQFLDHTHTRKRVPLYRDKRASQSKLLELIQDDDRRAEGIADPFVEARKLPLADHLAAYRRHLAAKGNSPDYVDQATHYVELVLDGCGFTRLKDLSAGRVSDFLQSLKDKGRANATVNYYLTAIKGFCRWLVVDRRIGEHRLAHLTKLNEQVDVRVERRPLTTDEFTRLIQAARSRAARFRRLSGVDRAMLYQVAAYTGLRASELASLDAGSLDTEGERPTIVVEAGYSKRRRRDEQPLPAWLADRLAAWIAATAPETPATLPIRPAGPEAAEASRKGTRRKLWPGSWPQRAADMIRADLAAARVAWLNKLKKAGCDPKELERHERSDFLRDVDQAGRVFDFHALRHQFISSLSAAGVHPKTAQELARHSTIDLTMNYYTHLAVADLTGALDCLPELPESGPQAEPARATGTDDKATPAAQKARYSSERPRSLVAPKMRCSSERPPILVAPRVAPTRGKRRVLEAISDHDGQEFSATQETTKPLDNTRVYELATTSRPGRIRTTDKGIMSPLL